MNRPALLFASLREIFIFSRGHTLEGMKTPAVPAKDADNHFLCMDRAKPHVMCFVLAGEALQCWFSSLTPAHSSTLTPMHLRKAKLMFFFVRYPSSSVLKTYFPDIKFNKNNTAQLVKWFSNFR